MRFKVLQDFSIGIFKDKPKKDKPKINPGRKMRRLSRLPKSKPG